jgi:hypothetical protein
LLALATMGPKKLIWRYTGETSKHSKSRQCDTVDASPVQAAATERARRGKWVEWQLSSILKRDLW